MSFDDQFTSSGFHTDFDDYEVLERISPPSYLFFIQIASSLIGLALGILGLSLNGDLMHWLFGGLGWIFAIGIPVGVTVNFQNWHQNYSRKGLELAEQGKSYDAYAGDSLRKRMSKALVLSFLVAIVPIYVLALPFGEALAV